jgi:hypothetical protein
VVSPLGAIGQHLSFLKAPYSYGGGCCLTVYPPFLLIGEPDNRLKQPALL